MESRRRLSFTDRPADTGQPQREAVLPGVRQEGKPGKLNPGRGRAGSTRCFALRKQAALCTQGKTNAFILLQAFLTPEPVA